MNDYLIAGMEGQFGGWWHRNGKQFNHWGNKQIQKYLEHEYFIYKQICEGSNNNKTKEFKKIKNSFYVVAISNSVRCLFERSFKRKRKLN